MRKNDRALPVPIPLLSYYSISIYIKHVKEIAETFYTTLQIINMTGKPSLQIPCLDYYSPVYVHTVRSSENLKPLYI